MSIIPAPASSPWVPVWDLEGGVNLTYKGSWAAGSYVDGDVVVYQGTTYMCVRPTSVAPVPWPLAPQAASFGTTPPANPVDGQIWILPVDAAGTLWQFRYNAASASAYKWEFVGGAEVSVYAAAIATSPGATTNLGPTITVPRAGDYTIDASCSVSNAVADGLCILSVAGMAESTQFNSNPPRWGVLMVRGRANGLAASAVVQPQGGGSGGTISFQNRRLSVIPVRVS